MKIEFDRKEKHTVAGIIQHGVEHMLFLSTSVHPTVEKFWVGNMLNYIDVACDMLNQVNKIEGRGDYYKKHLLRKFKVDLQQKAGKDGVKIDLKEDTKGKSYDRSRVEQENKLWGLD